jgi:DNA-binding transcriptional regulator YhcF (GntR family)
MFYDGLVMGIKDNRPIYLQLADWLMDEILLEHYLPDERVPSVRDSASRLQVNANTAVRAYEHLETAGVIYNRRGLGYFVSPNAAKIIVDARRKEFFSTEMSYFFGRLKSMGMTPEELSAHYTDFLRM